MLAIIFLLLFIGGRHCRTQQVQLVLGGVLTHLGVVAGSLESGFEGDQVGDLTLMIRRANRCPVIVLKKSLHRFLLKHLCILVTEPIIVVPALMTLPLSMTIALPIPLAVPATLLHLFKSLHAWLLPQDRNSLCFPYSVLETEAGRCQGVDEASQVGVTDGVSRLLCHTGAVLPLEDVFGSLHIIFMQFLPNINTLILPCITNLSRPSLPIRSRQPRRSNGRNVPTTMLDSPVFVLLIGSHHPLIPDLCALFR